MTPAKRAAIICCTLLGASSFARSAEPIYVEFFNAQEQLIAGPVRVAWHRGSLEGLSFLHAWSVQTDPATGLPAGSAQEQALDISVPVGPASPLLINALTKNAGLSRVVFHFVRTTPAGEEEEFYRVTIHRAQFIGREMRLFDVLDPANAMRDLVETYSFAYRSLDVEDPGIVRQLLYLPGDTNGDLLVDISDAIQLLGYLFLGSEMRCPLSGDTNADGQLDISDGVALLNFLFAGTRPPPPPFPSCGEVPQGTAIPCGATVCEAGA